MVRFRFSIKAKGKWHYSRLHALGKLSSAVA